MIGGHEVNKTSKRGNVWARAAYFMMFAAALGAAPPPGVDAAELVRRSLEAGRLNAEHIPSWLSGYVVDEKQTGEKGEAKSEETRTYDYVLVDGVYIRKLIAKNDKPLSADEAKREDQRAARLVRARKEEDAEAKEKRLAERAKKKRKEREFSNEILEAFAFKLVGEESAAGRSAWVVAANPRPGYKPKDMRASIFPHVRGKIWIDEKDYLWSKAEADAFEPISAGVSFVAKLDEGAHLFFEQVRMGDGTWLLKKSGIRANARVMMVKRVAIDQTTVYRNFRSVPAGAEVDDTSPK